MSHDGHGCSKERRRQQKATENLQQSQQSRANLDRRRQATSQSEISLEQSARPLQSSYEPSGTQNSATGKSSKARVSISKEHTQTQVALDPGEGSSRIARNRQRDGERSSRSSRSSVSSPADLSPNLIPDNTLSTEIPTSSSSSTSEESSETDDDSNLQRRLESLRNRVCSLEAKVKKKDAEILRYKTQHDYFNAQAGNLSDELERLSRAGKSRKATKVDEALEMAFRDKKRWKDAYEEAEREMENLRIQLREARERETELSLLLSDANRALLEERDKVTRLESYVERKSMQKDVNASDTSWNRNSESGVEKENIGNQSENDGEEFFLKKRSSHRSSQPSSRPSSSSQSSRQKEKGRNYHDLTGSWLRHFHR